MEDPAIDDTQQNAEVVPSQEHIMEIVEGKLARLSKFRFSCSCFALSC